MAGGFSFPPPPPPPPKSAAPSQQPDSDYNQQSSYQGRGRGGYEPRGRGAGRGRGGGGRSKPNFDPASHAQHSNFNHGQGYSHSTTTQHDPSSWQQTNSGAHATSANSRPPPGSYVNPNFAGPQPSTNANLGYRPPGSPNSQSSPFPRHDLDQSSNYTPSAPNNGPGRSQSGHKRKLDALRGPQQPREKKPGPQTAPSVPSFGASILPPPPAAPNRQPANTKLADSGNKSAGGSKTLGLTPSNGIPPAYPSDSEDEDVDEEAQFAELGTKLTFEHNGEVMTLNNEADLAAWKEERRKQFPTNNRVSQKESERLRVGEERKRLLAAVAKLHQAPRNRHVQTKTRSLRGAQEPSEDQNRRPQPDATTSERDDGLAGIQPVQEVKETTTDTNEEPTAEAPTEAPAIIQQANPGASANVDTDMNMTAAAEEQAEVSKRLPGIDMDESEDESTAEATGAKPASESEEDEESSSDSDSDDDGPPEQTSSKPPPSAASDAQRPVCRYFAASGRCRNGDGCRFRHELSSKAPSARPVQPQEARPAFDRYAPKLDPKPHDRKSIFERLVEQEQEGDDRLALQVIKALGQARFFAKETNDEEV